MRSVPDWVEGRIVVDDGSQGDGFSERFGPGVIYIRHKKNLGVGAAIITGYRTARRLGFDIAIVMAGDGQMDPQDLERVVEPVLSGMADYVKGERLTHPECKKVMPLVRRLGNYALTFATRLITGEWGLLDAQCGYTAIRLEVIDRLPLDFIYPRYGFPNDFLAALAGAGFRIAQVTVRPIYNGEPSGINPFLALLFYPLVIAKAAITRAVASFITHMRISE